MPSFNRLRQQLEFALREGDLPRAKVLLAQLREHLAIEKAKLAAVEKVLEEAHAQEAL